MPEQYTRTGFASAKPQQTGSRFFLIMNISMLFLLPALSIAGELIYESEPFGWALIGKWFIFWAVGIRLFTAGINQASNPAFTGSIFHLKSQESFVVIRELGFANISLGIMGILSVINSNWRILAAIAGGLYLGLAGIQHVFKKPDSRNEVIAMLYDLMVMLVVIVYLSVIFFNQ
jgi:hypothetical protein